MLTPLEEFGSQIARAVTVKAAALPVHTILCTSAFMLLGIALFFLIMSLERKARQAFFRATAPKLGHYVWLAAMLLFLFPVWESGRGRSGFWEYLIPVLITMLFLAAEAALLFWKRAGLYLSLFYVWAALPLKELTVITITEKDRAALASYSPAGMMGVYAADRYLLDRVSALAMAAFFLTVWLAAYYGRRRLLFREEEKRTFYGLSKCVYCASPLIGEGDFCSVCGADNSGRGRSVPRKEPLDAMKYCQICGGVLVDGKCAACRSAKKLSDTVGEDLKEGIRKSVLSLAGKILTVVLIAGILLMPLTVPDPLSRMAEGSGKTAGEVSSLFQAWTENPGLTEDETFRKSFDSALSGFNERLFAGFDFEGTGRLTYTELYGYLGYLDAAWKEAAVLDAMGKAVDSGGDSDAALLKKAFASAEEERIQSLRSGLRFAVSLSQDGFLQRVQRTATDSLSFYLSFVPPYLLAAVCALLAIAATVWGFIQRMKNREASPFVSRADDLPGEGIAVSRIVGKKLPVSTVTLYFYHKSPYSVNSARLSPVHPS